MWCVNNENEVKSHAAGAMSLMMVRMTLLMAQTVVHAYDPAFVPMLCCAQMILCCGIQLSIEGASYHTMLRITSPAQTPGTPPPPLC